MNLLKLYKYKHISKSSGGYSHYYQLTKNKGIKVFLHDDYKNLNCIRTNQKHTIDVIMEYLILKEFEQSELVPKVYKITWVQEKKNDSIYLLGIVMQHINGVILKDHTNDLLESEKLINKFNRKFYKVCFRLKINVFDDHDENYIVDKQNKIWRIDFSNDYLKYSKKKYKTVCNLLYNDIVAKFPKKY